jgi:hypothetical protein
MHYTLAASLPNGHCIRKFWIELFLSSKISKRMLFFFLLSSFANISSGTHGSGTGVTSNRPERTSQEMVNAYIHANI